MRYEGSIFRPPSEAKSLLLQVTYGCSHNLCTFCGMYADKKFKVRDLEEILKDITNFPDFQIPFVRRIFLIDGNPLVIGMEKLMIILDAINAKFPNLERVGAYTTSKDVCKFSTEDLKKLKNKKLKIFYIGVETGSEKILKLVRKGSTNRHILEAAPKIKEAGIMLSTMILTGLGGSSLLEEHAIESAKIISDIKPDYLSLLTLMNRKGTQLDKDVKSGKFKMLSQIEVLRETILFIENLSLENTIFRVSHPSNIINIAGVLNEDKEDILTDLYSIDEDEIRQYSFSQLY